MVIIKYSNNIMRCPFSKNIIKVRNKICLFNEKQYNAFIKIIYQKLWILPNEIIEIIIKKINYKKYINRFGKEKYCNWTKLLKNNKKNTNNYQIKYGHSSSSTSDSRDTSDSRESSDY